MLIILKERFCYVFRFSTHITFYLFQTIHYSTSFSDNGRARRCSHTDRQALQGPHRCNARRECCTSFHHRRSNRIPLRRGLHLRASRPESHRSGTWNCRMLPRSSPAPDTNSRNRSLHILCNLLTSLYLSHTGNWSKHFPLCPELSCPIL